MNKNVQATIARLQTIEQELNAALIARSHVVRGSLVAIISLNHVLQIGAPGEAKSLLTILMARHFSRRNGAIKLFVDQVDPDTHSEEIVGPFSVNSLTGANGAREEYKRIVDDTLVDADFAFIDEVVNANSAVKKKLLGIMNERKFRNGRDQLVCPLISMWGAGNTMPEEEESWPPFFDRWGLRYIIEHLSPADLRKMTRLSRNPAAPTTVDLEDLQELQEFAANMPVPDGIHEQYHRLIDKLGEEKIWISPRRVNWGLDMLRAHAALEGKSVPDEDDLAILIHAFWMHREEQAKVKEIVNSFGNPYAAQADAHRDAAAALYATWKEASQAVRQEILEKIAEADEALTTLSEQNENASGKIHPRVAAHATEVAGWRQELFYASLGKRARRLASE